MIVEHYTESTTMLSAWSLFAQDVPDSELHELPGTCAHFIVDRDGTIYQLVPLDVICRHTVGLNATALGIEHVGMSDAEILADPAQMRASLHLTAWLMQRYHIAVGDVIGHAESLTSPYHHELDPAWRCQTHADWQPADMTRLPRPAARAPAPLPYRRRVTRILSNLCEDEKFFSIDEFGPFSVKMQGGRAFTLNGMTEWCRRDSEVKVG